MGKKKIKFRPNYEKLYPGLDISPEILTVLKKGDRRDEYESYHLKSARRIKDEQGNIIGIKPGREISLEFLLDQGVCFIDDSMEPEKLTVEQVEKEALYQAIAALNPEEKRLLVAIFFNDMTERGYAKATGNLQQTIHSRKKAILKKLKKLIKKRK